MIQSASVCFSCTCTTSTFFARIAFFCHIVSIETFIFPQNPCSETIISKLSLVSLKFLPSCFWKRGGKLNCKVLNTREFFSRSREGSLGPYAHFLSVGVSSTISLKTRRLKNIGLMLIQGCFLLFFLPHPYASTKLHTLLQISYISQSGLIYIWREGVN